jgi:prolyl 4-hydroxylase
MKTVLADNLFTVSGLLNGDECLRLIERGEALGFQSAAIRTRSGPQMRTDIRNNDRAEFYDGGLALELWRRCAPFVPVNMEGGTAEGLDNNFRYYRYDVGQRFNRHQDGTVRRGDLRSRLTCLFYLNDGFSGGETVFYSNVMVDQELPIAATVVPKAGDALFFRHDWWHEGRLVESGRKYVLRSDVFYRFDVDQSR